MESQIFECPTCLISFTGLDNFQKHVNSLGHALMVESKSPGNVTDEEKIDNYIEPVPVSDTRSSSFLNEVSLECKICQKLFSGTIPYVQHMKSATHLKKSTMTENSSQNCQANLLKCDICDKSFSGSIPYDQHMISNAHEKKVIAKQLFEKTKSVNMSSDIAQSTNNEDNTNYKNVKQSSSLQYNTVAGFRCDICDKNFSGIIPYDQHQKSNVHKKKVQQKEMMKKSENLFLKCDSTTASKADDELSANAQSMEIGELEIAEPMEVGKINQVPNYFLGLSCKICDKQFSGPIPFEQHMASTIHKKKALEKHPIKMQQDTVLPSNQTVKDTSTRSFDFCIRRDLSSSVGTTFSCEVCNKHFNGSIPLEMHLNSSTHQKKVWEKEASKKTNDCNAAIAPDSTIGSQAEFILNGNSLELEEKRGTFGINQIRQESNSDLILEDLNIITPEMLNITIFRSDENIRFDITSNSRGNATF